MSNYDKGRRVEYAVIKDLKEQGYTCTRAASSKGVADVIAIKEGQVLLVSVKLRDFPLPGERQRLLTVAHLLPGVGVPLVAIGKPSLTYWRLTTVNVREPWTPDEVAA